MNTIKRHSKVDLVQRDGEGYFVYLKKGWTIDNAGCHCFSAISVRDALQQLSEAWKCHCSECLEG